MNWIKTNKNILFLFVIVLVGAILRLYRLGDLPALNADEAALGYNAFSLIKTGRDEHGNSWPLHFQSFNDYKPGLLVYIIMPLVYVFGLSEWSVRLIPSVAGIITIPVVYLLTKEVVINAKSRFVSANMPLYAALMLAVSPWHIHFSRGAWEVNVATLFICLGVLMFLQLKKLDHALIYSFVFFAISLYTYHAARIVVPLLVFFLLFYYYKDILKIKSKLFLAILIGVIVSLPLIFSFFGPSGLARAGGVAIWADQGPENRINELRGDHQDLTGIIPRLLHNKPVGYTLAVFNNWAEHYWGEFLFLSGDDIERNKVPETGQMHLVEALFIFFGLYRVVKEKDNTRWKFVFLWLLVAPLPAAITFQSPHALRAASMVIPLILIASLGFTHILEFVNLNKRSKHLRVLLMTSVFLLYSASVSRYLHMYYVHMKKEYPFSSQYGVKELVQYLSPIHNKYTNVVITDRYDQPYILFLFYLKYDPAIFQKEHTLTSRDLYGFSTVRSFSNFRFESIKYSSFLSLYPDSLIIGSDKEILPEGNILQDIYGSNGHRYFRIVNN